MRVQQSVAVSRKGGCRAALLTAGLLLPVGASRAADTRSPHAHHASAPGAGNAPAHLVHDTEARTPSQDKAARRSDRSSTAARKNAPATRHANRPDPAEPARRASKAHAGHKRHQELPVDEPMPVHRAQTERRRRNAQEELAGRKSSRANKTAALAQAPAPEAPTPRRVVKQSPPIPSAGVATVHTNATLTEQDFIRTARQAAPATDTGTAPASDSQGFQGQAAKTAPDPPAVFASGVSHPDDAERLPMHSADAIAAPSPATHTQQPAPIVRTKAPAVIATAAPGSSPQPTPNVVEGFGAEVDFHAPTTRPAPASGIVMPRETPAQQERDLRDAAEVASKPMFVPLYARDGKLIVPPPLKGSHDILVHQNQMADDAGLTRIQDDDDLARMRKARLLVDFQESASLHINEKLPENRRSARPWTVKFAADVAHAFYARFGEPLQVNSAVRTVAYQLRLQRTNGNAAAVEGEGASPHLTGQALDFGKRGMSVAEIAWMRSYLMPLIDAGQIDVEEEFQQACFHISVYASYQPTPRQHAPVRTELAQTARSAHARTPAGASGTSSDEGDLR